MKAAIRNSRSLTLTLSLVVSLSYFPCRAEESSQGVQPAKAGISSERMAYILKQDGEEAVRVFKALSDKDREQLVADADTVLQIKEAQLKSLSDEIARGNYDQSKIKTVLTSTVQILLILTISLWYATSEVSKERRVARREAKARQEARRSRTIDVPDEDIVVERDPGQWIETERLGGNWQGWSKVKAPPGVEVLGDAASVPEESASMLELLKRHYSEAYSEIFLGRPSKFKFIERLPHLSAGFWTAILGTQIILAALPDRTGRELVANRDETLKVVNRLRKETTALSTLFRAYQADGLVREANGLAKENARGT
ncbi:MAG: hypothetical protein C5B49_09370 [Bdellovibrio sp.]|nr:MAG: hypothetical protein C5B49_09370 [Bdellovibrio sp.]